MACEAHSKIVPIVPGDPAGCLMQSRLVPSVIDVYVRGEDHTSSHWWPAHGENHCVSPGVSTSSQACFVSSL